MILALHSITQLTLLHATCDAGNSVKIVQELLEAGAKVDMVDKYGMMALLLLTDWVFQGCKADIAATNCNINVKAKNDETTLFNICTWEKMNDTFFTLVQAGANLMVTTHNEDRNVLLKGTTH